MVKAKVANPANRFAAGCLTIAFGGLWITLWSGVTLTIDGILVSSAVWHLLALGHPTVQGEVIESRVVEKSDSEGTSYQPLIRYRYTVARNEYVGDTSQGMALTLAGQGTHVATSTVFQLESQSLSTTTRAIRPSRSSIRA